MGLKSMNAGDGETSYAKNSGLQKVVISKTWPVLDETLKDMLILENGFPKRMKMADLGCASGPNTLFLVSHIANTIQDLCEHNNINNDLPELEVYLNDIPDNDFNNLFKLMSQNNANDEMKRLDCFMYGAPGSFYGRLFPSSSLHFAFSSYSLHWLSQIPIGKNNKENIHMSMKSPPEIFEAYAKQFQLDFSRFLSLRGEEIIAGGRMVLTFVARRAADPSPNDGVIKVYTPLTEILLDMVAEGMVEEDDLYSFNVPMYPPCLQEVEAIINDEGSFNLDKMEVVLVPWYANDEHDDTVFDENRSGKFVADIVRAFMEPMLVSHFGPSLNLDRVFDIYAKKMASRLSIERSSFLSPVISLTRK